MTGKQIRSWAWNRAREDRGLLIAVVLTGIAAGIPATIAGRLLANAAWPVRTLAPLPLRLLGSLVQMGALFVALRAAQGRETEYRQISAPFRREWWKKAVLLAAVYLVLTPLVQLGPDLLAIRAQELENGGLLNLSYGLGVALGLLLSGIWFPVEYMLFLNPEKGAGQVLREGLALGVRSLGRILAFQFWVALPLLLPILSVLLAGEVGSSGMANLLTVLWLGLLIWVTPYLSLAQAGLALNLAGKRPKGNGRKKGT